MTATEPVTDPLIAAALDYISRGWYVLPLRVYPKPDGRKDVHLPANWRGVSTNDPDQVRAWFAPGGPWHGGSLAIDTGKSGLVVVDLDTSGDKNGLRAWADIGGPAASLMHVTPSNGVHLYFRADANRPVGIDSHGKLGHGIDVRGEGGLVIAPPSADWRGSYQTTTYSDWQHLLPVPDIVVERVPLGGGRVPSPSDATPGQRDPSGLGRLTTGDGIPKYTRQDANRRIQSALATVMSTPQGSGFNHALNEAAFELGHWTNAHLTRDDAEQLLFYAVTAQFPYGPDRDDLATIESGLSAGEAKPYAILSDQVAEMIPDGGPADDEFEHEVQKAYWRLKAGKVARERLAAEDTPGDGDGRVDWDLLDRPPAPTVWRVDKLLAEGRSYSIVGGPKSGKSTTARHLAVRAAEAGHRVLYLDRENIWEKDWVPQLQGMGVQKQVSQFLDVRCFPAIPPLDTQAGADMLIQWVQQTGATVVFIDMIMRFLAGKENDSDTFNAFDRLTGQRLKSMGVTVVRLDHTGKGDDAGARGSSAKSGDVDVQWMLSRSGGTVTLDPKGISRTAEHADPVRLMIQGGRLLPVDSTIVPVNQQGEPDETVQRNLGILLDQGSITLKTSLATVQRLLQERQQGVRREKLSGQWAIFLASRGDGVAAGAVEAKRTKLTPFTIPSTDVPQQTGSQNGSQDQQSPPATSGSAIPDDHENDRFPPVPGTGSHDHGTAGTGQRKSSPDQRKRGGNRSGNRGNR